MFIIEIHLAAATVMKRFFENYAEIRELLHPGNLIPNYSAEVSYKLVHRDFFAGLEKTALCISQDMATINASHSNDKSKNKFI